MKRSIKYCCLSVLLAVLVLSIPLGCGKEPAPEDSPEAGSFSGSIGTVEALLEEYPAYREAKTAMDAEDWDRAAGVLAGLLAEEDPPAAFANDLGVVEMRRENMEAAMEALERAIEMDPDYERAWYNKGLLHARLEQPDEAEEAYRRAVEINPFYYEALYNLGLLYYQEGRLMDAEAAFRSISTNTRAARFNRVYYQLGLIAADTGDDASAVKFYDESLLLDPSHVPSYLNKAAALIRLGQPERARNFLGKAQALDPSDARVSWNIGLAWLSEDNDPEARAAFEETLALDPEYAPAHVNLAAIAMRAGDLERARNHLHQAASLDPENPAIPWNRGLIAADMGNDEAAIRHFQRAINLDPQHAEAYLNLGAAALRLYDMEKARASIRRARELAPGDFRVSWNQGLIALRENKPEEAREAFLKVVDLNPEYGPALFNLGLQDYRAGRLEKARAFFHRAAYAKADEPYPEAHYMLAKTYSDLENFNAAINEYEIALRVRPDYPEAAYNLALNLDKSGDKEGAVEIYRELAESPDPPPEALNNLAAFHLAGNELDAAIPLLERALAADPSYATAAYNLGLARLRDNRFAEAADAFSRTLELEPENFAAWKNLGIARARLDQTADALRAMEKAFQLNPADADTAVYVVKYLKLLDRPEEAVTEVYRTAYEAGGRNPLMLRHLGQAAFDTENYGQAAEYYSEYIKLRPSPVYIYNMGLAYLRNDQFPEAIDAFSQATRLDPSNFAYWKNLGIAFSRMEDYESALNAMRRAFELNPADPDSAVYVVKYLKLLDRPVDSVTAVYQQAYASGARDNLILSHLSETALEAGAFARAVEFLKEATRVYPDDFAYWKNLGIAYSRMEDYPSAESAMRQAFSLNPADADTAVYLVKYLKLLDRPESEMTRVYQEAYEAGARDTFQLRHLARAASDREDWNAAARYYEDYLKLRPSPVYYYNLGLNLRRAERFEEARAAYQQAVEGDPQFEKAWVNLGYVHAFLGETGRAEAAFLQALKIDPDYENAASALKELKNGTIQP